MTGKVAHSRGRLQRQRCHDEVATGLTVFCGSSKLLQCSNRRRNGVCIVFPFLQTFYEGNEIVLCPS